MNFPGEMEAYYHSMRVSIPPRHTYEWIRMYEEYIEHVINESTKRRI